MPFTHPHVSRWSQEEAPSALNPTHLHIIRTPHKHSLTDSPTHLSTSAMVKSGGGTLSPNPSHYTVSHHTHIYTLTLSSLPLTHPHISPHQQWWSQEEAPWAPVLPSFPRSGDCQTHAPQNTPRSPLTPSCGTAPHYQHCTLSNNFINIRMHIC